MSFFLNAGHILTYKTSLGNWEYNQIFSKKIVVNNELFLWAKNVNDSHFQKQQDLEKIIKIGRMNKSAAIMLVKRTS